MEDFKIFWTDGELLYPKVVPLVIIPEYKRPLLRGLVLSIGSKNEAAVGLVVWSRQYQAVVLSLAFS